jgi:DNA replication protein DnaC
MTELTPTELKARLKALGLFGLIACLDQIADKPWLAEVLAIEERERQKRGLERRVRNARVGAFKPMVDFDWNLPKKIDREAIDELCSLAFMKTGHNGVLVGPNGVGKTMILKNVAHQALVRGHTVRFATASDMLADLAAQDSSSALARRLRRYTVPQLLCVDEVGYLSYDNRYADLLFEASPAATKRRKSLVLSTNKAFAGWSEVFPHAACVVTLVDRLIHRAEVIDIEAESYRLKEAKENNAARSKRRGKKPPSA